MALLQMQQKVCQVSQKIMAAPISDQYGVSSMQVLISEPQQLRPLSAAAYCGIQVEYTLPCAARTCAQHILRTAFKVTFKIKRKWH